MQSLPELLQQSTAHAWLFVPSAILLGALHGLEPGHSKTMMAAFIVAIQGTVTQAVLLGLSAALSHTAVVWVVAVGGQYLGRDLNAGTTEPYFQIASAVIILGVAAWMIWRTWRDQNGDASGHHHHDAEVQTIDTGHGQISLEIFEDGVPPRWRVSILDGASFGAADVTIETTRPDGAEQGFSMAAHDGYLESIDAIPEPHTFKVRMIVKSTGHSHAYEVVFQEHSHSQGDASGLTIAGDGAPMDAHERAHATDIAHRFSGRRVTTGQIVVFGLTGGLIPCPAAITVLLLCLQLKQLALGAALVLCFSIGLAVTMVAAGVAAALSVRHIQARWAGFAPLVRRAPYASGGLMVMIALYMGVTGWLALHGLPTDPL